MKTIFFTILMSCSAILFAQPSAVCINELRVSVNGVGEARIFPQVIDDGSTGFDALSLDRDFFDCDDIGSPIEVTLTASTNDGASSTCTCDVIVEDKLAPLAVCEADFTLTLDENGRFEIIPETFDAGSYDNCGPLTYSTIPTVLTCSDAGETVDVQLIVTDPTGLQTTCVTQVVVEGFIDQSVAMVCNSELTVYVSNVTQEEITPFDILVGGPYTCESEYTLEITDANGDVVPDNIITADYINQTLQGTVTDPAIGNACWSNIVVLSGEDCDEEFIVCDTLCRSEPLGDCASGHTADDDVEWPCDVSIDGCTNDAADYSPEGLITLYGVDPADARPWINPEKDCVPIAFNYEDEVFLVGGNVKILRDWIIVDWNTTTFYRYIQTIVITAENSFICDTLPWDAPVTDCNGGHTLDDAVEWPADIVYSGCDVSPQALANDTAVNPFNVEPRFFSECTLSYAYRDVVFAETDSTGTVERTWVVVNWPTGELFEYTQNISYNAAGCANMVCVKTPSFIPVPNVSDIDDINFNTGADGCDIIPSGITSLTPVKDDDIAAGIDLNDLIALTNHILGLELLTGDALLAADLNQDGEVTVADYIILSDILQGALSGVSSDYWIFRDRSNNFGTLDVVESPFGNQYVGIKLGDINHSYNNEEGLIEGDVSFTALDDILNRGMTYALDVKTENRQLLAGLSATFSYDEDALENISVSSDLLGFNPSEDVRVENGKIIISYQAPLSVIQTGGILLDENSTVFTISYLALENKVHSSVIDLEESLQSTFAEPFGGTLRSITWNWDDQITANRDIRPADTHINIFPNPVHDELNVQLEENLSITAYQIYNMQGVLVTSGLWTGTSAHISDLNSGIYFLQLIDDHNTIYISRFTKQ